MQDKQAILETDNMYHVYNRANGSECLFVSDENYRFFLRKFEQYISPIADTFCYCLMPNHFHFLVKIKSEKDVEEYIRKRSFKSKTLQGFKTLEGLAEQEYMSKFLTQQFSHFFNSYTQSFNKQQYRKGSLFMHPYKRKAVTTQEYLIKLIHYIHYNPVEAVLCSKPEDWLYSSYRAIISNLSTSLDRNEIIALFDDLSNFIFCHNEQPRMTGIELY